MAQIDFDNCFGFVDKRAGRGYAGASSLVEQNNYDNVTDMRTRLAALNAGYYTSARLDAMTKNDMVYNLRVLSDTAGII
jgi:hypothetical protein